MLILGQYNLSYLVIKHYLIIITYNVEKTPAPAPTPMSRSPPPSHYRLVGTPNAALLTAPRQLGHMPTTNCHLPTAACLLKKKTACRAAFFLVYFNIFATLFLHTHINLTNILPHHLCDIGYYGNVKLLIVFSNLI